MPEAEPKPKEKLSEASVQLLKATATIVGADSQNLLMMVSAQDGLLPK
jgi:hypothetical protein